MASFAHRLLKARRAWPVAIVVIAVIALWLWTPYVRGFLIRRELNQPYLVELGRGSGWHGLETVKVLADGAVVLHRFTVEHEAGLEIARLTLPPSALAQVAAAIEKNRLFDLQRMYHRPELADGTQWVLRVRVGDREKVVYCDNRFPPEVRRFAADLDHLLTEHGAETADWRPVTYAPARAYERDLWASIRRP